MTWWYMAYVDINKYRLFLLFYKGLVKINKWTKQKAFAYNDPY